MPFASLKEVYGDDFVTTIQQNTQQPNFQYKSLFNGKLDELETSPETENINKEIESFVSDYSNGLESYEMGVKMKSSEFQSFFLHLILFVILFVTVVSIIFIFAKSVVAVITQSISIHHSDEGKRMCALAGHKQPDLAYCS